MAGTELYEKNTPGVDASTDFMNEGTAGNTPTSTAPINKEHIDAAKAIISGEPEGIERVLGFMTKSIESIMGQSLISLGEGVAVNKKLIDIVGDKLNDSLNMGISNIMIGAMGFMTKDQGAAQQVMLAEQDLDKLRSRTFAALGATEILGDPDSTETQKNNAKGTLGGYYNNIYAGKSAFQSAGALGGLMQTLIALKQTAQSQAATSYNKFSSAGKYDDLTQRDLIYKAKTIDDSNQKFLETYGTLYDVAESDAEREGLKNRKARILAQWSK